MEKCGDKQRERRRRREKGEIDRKERKRDRNEKQENCVLNKKKVFADVTLRRNFSASFCFKKMFEANE